MQYPYLVVYWIDSTLIPQARFFHKEQEAREFCHDKQDYGINVRLIDLTKEPNRE